MKIPRKTFVLFFTLAGFSGAFSKPLTDSEVAKRAGKIDSLLLVGLEKAGLEANDKIDDGTFVRRAYLEIIGRIPTVDEARTFLESTDEGKREALIDSLVASPGFDSHLFNWAADLLRVKTKQEEFGLGWHVWLRQSLAEDKPWDKVVFEMLASTGHTVTNPAVGYYLRDRNMQLDNFSNTMQVFLGRQIGCAQCHDHPFDDWTQMDYYQMAAFTGGIDYKSVEASDSVKRVVDDLATTIPKPYKEDKGESKKRFKTESRQIMKSIRPVFGTFDRNAIFENGNKTLRLPEDYQYADAEPKTAVEPMTLFGERISGVDSGERKDVFARWVTSPVNPYFSKVIANRLWARTFGHGLLDPVDDWSDDSRPAHPEVLAYLEKTMKEVDYDLRQFSRILFRTDLFQRECDVVEPNPGVPHLVQGPRLKRMSAEQLYDSLLVLKFGESQDEVFQRGVQRWENYTAQIEGILEMESEDLVALGAVAIEARGEYDRLRGVVFHKQKELREAKTAKEKERLKKEISETNKEVQRLGKLRDPAKPGSSQMIQMGGGGNNERQRNMRLRASELPAPFKPGSLVRDFGGSDRDTPSSGESVATVPQALTLLNDRDADFMDRKGYLWGTLQPMSAEERLNTVFLGVYSRFPSAEEKERYTDLAERPLKLRDLTRAMLTTDRFIFIQ